MKKEWKHLSLDQRSVISSGINHNYKLKDIAESIGFDPISISKEVKRNRIGITIGLNSSNCKKLNRWPYVCLGCKERYRNCPFIENNNVIDKSVITLYRYVNKNYLTTKRIDLPYAVKLKKRKHNKKYEYSNNKIDRSNHTYLDYLAFIHQNPGVFVWQLDFLGA